MADHHYIPMFNLIPADTGLYVGDEYSNAQRIQASGIEALTVGSQYALHHAQSLGALQNHQFLQSLKSPPRPRRHTYEPASRGIRKDARSRSLGITNDSKGGSGPIRRRISRACDQCNQLRTKCDGMGPCSHCVDFSLSCRYYRERKKRGKASRKDIAEHQVAAASSASPSSPICSPHASPNQVQESNLAESSRISPARLSSVPRTMSASNAMPPQQPASLPNDLSGVKNMGVPSNSIQSNRSQHANQISDAQQLGGQSLDTPGSMRNYVFIQDYHNQPIAPVAMDENLSSMHTPVVQIPQSMEAGGDYPYMHNTFDLMHPQDSLAVGVFPFDRGAEPQVSDYVPTPPITGSEGWFPLSSPASGQFDSNILMSPTILRYPVLQTLMPSLSGILPPLLACELLELYFTNSSLTHNHPISPYVLGYVFRRRSFLHPTRPRNCSPALLASILWIAAQTSDAPFLTSSPAARGKTCQKLLELTISFLRPLAHGPGIESVSDCYLNAPMDGVSAAGYGILANDDESVPGIGCAGPGSLDDIVTYFHCATVLSASDHKAASLRWWSAAWALARELKLGRELPLNEGMRGAGHSEDADADGEFDLETGEHNRMSSRRPSGSPRRSYQAVYSEEEREERRRTWWLLYTVDRHLALCYNRPLFLLDAECTDLLQPIHDIVWQAGEYYTGDASLLLDPEATQPTRRCGPSFECTSHSIFGFFTPLMTILGEIVELNQARKHPCLGTASRSISEWDSQTAEINRQLIAYGRSLGQFEARCATSLRTEHHHLDGPQSANSGLPHMRENIMQTKKVVAYGTHIMHVLHILVAGNWDPISLLEDSDLWITSQSFTHATERAVSAAEATSKILEYDPDLNFMPFFFGIYLLQGSFILLPIADKLQIEAGQSVVSACEVVVRAVEACVVTLNTEYQRNFRNVLRSALAQVTGYIPEDFSEQQHRRREALALYRWTGDGTGLAI